MTDFKQYNLETPKPAQSYGQDSPNVLRIDKDLNIKNQFTVNNVEAQNKLGSKQNIKFVDASYSVQLNDFIIGVSNTATQRTITLPKPSVAGFGKVYIIKDTSGSATSTTIAIAPNGTELINGDTSAGVITNYGSLGFVTDGVNWFIV